MKDIQAIIASFDRLGYVVDEDLATILFLTINLRKPLLLEGNPGVGKTEVAQMLASHLETTLIRLQCYEGLDIHATVYEWNYQKQLLSIKIQEHGDKDEREKERHIFSKDYLLERPLLKAISARDKPPVLLIDEVDRADEEFEAYLLELLSVYQISIPELGTIKAKHPPFVVLTSNRTRELGDALKRRCLFHWVDYPDFEKEVLIIKKHIPGIEDDLCRRLTSVVQQLRLQDLEKSPGISESIDWAAALLALGHKQLDDASFQRSLGCLLKSANDIEKVKAKGLTNLPDLKGEV